jgi:imidazole glycerol-phosphate synthase subunit HisH
MNDVLLIDAGTGNLRSVQKALESLGADVLRTNDPRKVLSGRPIVLPGVGAFGNFMSGLREQGLDTAVKEAVKNGVPLLGICVGMQALFEVGEELGEHSGLGLLKGAVVRFDGSNSIKIPHTGWNQVQMKKETSLFNGIHNGAYVYFNHSYYCRVRDSLDILATTEYGINYASAVARDNIFGVQFHPEKSQSAGLRILHNFLEAV